MAKAGVIMLLSTLRAQAKDPTMSRTMSRALLGMGIQRFSGRSVRMETVGMRMVFGSRICLRMTLGRLLGGKSQRRVLQANGQTVRLVARITPQFTTGSLGQRWVLQAKGQKKVFLERKAAKDPPFHSQSFDRKRLHWTAKVAHSQCQCQVAPSQTRSVAFVWLAKHTAGHL